MAQTLLSHLADYADSIKYDDIPSNVIHETKLTIADTVGCMVSGSHHPDAHALIAAERTRGGHGTATVLGTNMRLSIEGAARANGYMGDIYELNDLTCGHSGIGNVAASLAMAEHVQATGQELIEAVATGIEVTSRIYSAYYPTMKPYTEVGIIPVGPIGSIGSAAACAKLMKLDRTMLLNAMATSIAQAGWCPAETVFGNGGTVKPLLFGSMPASTGIIGAIYAQHGITGPLQILESPMGYLNTVSQTYITDPILDTDTWYLDNPRRKLHACCGYIHSAIDSLIQIRKSGISLDKVSTVRVHMPGYIIPAVSKDAPPITPNEARFHSQYCMALALISEDVILPEHSENVERIMQRDDVARIVKAIQVVEDSSLSHYHQSRVEICGADGTILEERINYKPKGSPQNPMTATDVWEKFVRLSSPLNSALCLNSYQERLKNLEAEAATQWILAELNHASTTERA